jgi:hypothetical protein
MEGVKTSSEMAGEYDQEIDSTLAALGSVKPRPGLEKRVVAHLEMAPRLAWYHRLSLAPAGRHRLMIATASGVIVVGAMTMSGIHRHRMMPTPVPVTARGQRPHPSQQPVAAASGIGVNDHPLQSNIVRTHRHRGIHRSARAVHQRVPLPPGTGSPLRPALSSAAH